jgi:hypothetical protein
MSQVVVHVGSEAHVFSVGSMRWSPSETGPDVWCAILPQQDGSTVAEIEVSNCSIVPGVPSRSKPLLSAEVSVEGVEGVRMFWPSIWPMGRAAWRRFALPGSPNKNASAGNFCPSWRQRQKSYGPCNLPLPTLGTQQAALMLSADTASARQVLNALDGVLGFPFHVDDTADGVVNPGPSGWNCWGPSDPGQVGGTGIYFLRGGRQNIADLRRAFLIAQCEHERMRRWYRRDTGEPISTEDYPGQTPDLWGYPIPPEAMIPTAPDPLPTPSDFAHEIRGCSRTIQVAEQADSPMAKRSLAGLAGLARLRFSHRGRLPVPGYIPVNLRALQAQADLAPNTGLWGSTGGRQIAWAAFEVAESAKLSGWVGEARTWATAFLHLIDTASMPTGPLQKAQGPPFPAGVFTCQTFEQVILCYGIVGLARQLGVAIPMAVHRILEGIYGPNQVVGILPYYGSSTGPPHFIKTADDAGVPVPVLNQGYPNGEEPGDATHALSALALAASMDPNPLTWVQRGAIYDGTWPSWQQRLAYLTSATAPSNIEWYFGWMAAAQAVSS